MANGQICDCTLVPTSCASFVHFVLAALAGLGCFGRFSEAMAVVGVFVVLVLLYYLTSSKVTAKATVLFATTASFGMLVMSMQNLGLIGMMTIDWPVDLKGIFSVCQFLLLDIDSYGFSCIAGWKGLSSEIELVFATRESKNDQVFILKQQLDIFAVARATFVPFRISELDCSD